MSKENLFEDYTLEEAKSVLQRVSEYMDEVIEERRSHFYADGTRCHCKIIEDDMWNLAHDVLEIIHFPKSPTLQEALSESINRAVDMRMEEKIKEVCEASKKSLASLAEQLDPHLAKLVLEPLASLKKLKLELNDNSERSFESKFSGMMLKDVVFTLVNEYGWTYEDANRYVEKWGMNRGAIEQTGESS